MFKVWILSAGRAGDLGQMQLVANALGWPYDVVSVQFKRANPAALALWPEAYLEAATPSPFNGPLPDIVICAEATAGALAAKAKRAGLPFKLVCIGRPRGRFGDFDLIISAPQYALPEAANIVALPVAPHQRQSLTADDRALMVQFQDLKRPVAVVLVGGTSRPDTLDAGAAVLLAKEINERATMQGSVVVVTSPRTGRAATEALRSHLDSRVKFAAWSAGAANPYRALLAVGDRFIVTSDSVSMTVEALLTGKPTEIFSLPQKFTAGDVIVNWLSRQAMAGHLFEAGIIEARPQRQLLFESLAGNFRLNLQHTAPQDGNALPETAAHAAALIRSIMTRQTNGR
jgi:uncharacterized protein